MTDGDPPASVPGPGEARPERPGEARSRRPSDGTPRRGPGTAGDERRRPRDAAGRTGEQRRSGPVRPGRDERRAERGPRRTGRDGRRNEPAVAEGVTGLELDGEVRRQLLTLSKENAAGVAQHLVMAGRLLDDDPQGALEHAETAVRRAGRVPAAREAMGLVYYRLGEWAKALGELRTVRRMVDAPHLLPLMADCERALGRPERALEFAASDEALRLEPADRAELAIVAAGARQDLGQQDIAVMELRVLAARTPADASWSARAFYALADALTAVGDPQARDWFTRAAQADPVGETDAWERLDDLEGVRFTDLMEAEAEDSEPEPGTSAP